MTIKTPLALYVWPGRWNLPSIDAGCIEAILLLQLTCPARYSVVETTDLDASPNGHLPYLVHGQVVVASVPSITSYLKSVNAQLLALEEDDSLPSLNTAIDNSLSSRDRSKIPAWRAYIEGQLGTLMAHSLYVLEPNYTFIHRTFASMLPFPQQYYVPQRIRDSYKPRLEAAGLWHIKVEEVEKVERTFNQTGLTRENKRTVQKTFNKAQLYEKAKPVFDILSNLLQRKDFVFGNRPSTIDFALASRILLLGAVPLPEPVLKDLLTTTYPSLIAHATRVHAQAFLNPPPKVTEPTGSNVLQVMRGLVKSLERYVLTDHLETEEDKKFRRYRYGWYGLTALVAVGYLAVLKLQNIVVVVVPKDAGLGLPQSHGPKPTEDLQAPDDEEPKESEELEETEETEDLEDLEDLQEEGDSAGVEVETEA